MKALYHHEVKEKTIQKFRREHFRKGEQQMQKLCDELNCACPLLPPPFQTLTFNVVIFGNRPSKEVIFYMYKK